MEKSRGVQYTYGYYNAMNINHASFTLANQGIKPPKIKTACELGFGQGLSLVINSAASNSAWFGSDIEPSQVAFARSLSSHYQDRCKIYNEPFAHFGNNPSLEQFDFICLHGVWTWIGDDDRKIICDFLAKKLKPGGLLYISYNTLPSWVNFLPLQKLMAAFAENNKVVTSSHEANLSESFRFTERLLATNPAFLKVNPSVVNSMEKLKNQKANYLIHEYLAADFTPMTFDEMAHWLAPINMDYVCSSNVVDDAHNLHLTKEHLEFLSEIKNSVFQETCKDLMVNKQFRTDYWIKGAESLSKTGRKRELDKFSLILTRHSEDVELKFNGALGKAEGDEPIYRPLLNLLSNHEAKGYRDVINEMIGQGIEEAKAEEAVKMLFGLGCLAPFVNEDVSKTVQEDVKKLNEKIMERSINDELHIDYLGSSIIGGAFRLPKIDQMHIRSMRSGQKTQEELTDSAWRTMKMLGRRAIKESKTLETEKENLDYLKEHSQTFLTKSAPILRALGILE